MKRETTQSVTVVGGGLAGSEAALQLADRGVEVLLYEMRPQHSSPAHTSDRFAELVCSNSFKSDNLSTAAGLLKKELEILGSKLLGLARQNAVDAGDALAVDRDGFSASVTALLETHPRIEIRREEFVWNKHPASDDLIIAAGPLASDALADSLEPLLGDHLAFFDAIAPIISAESIDYEKAFFGSRYGKGTGKDYLNCPLDRDQYAHFHRELCDGERTIAHSFETGELFSACQPIEEIARRGVDALRYGALKPVGIADPHTGEAAYAIVQLRAEGKHKTAYNLVGFQTNLTWPEQRRIISLIPGLENAEILRYGVMHRNTYLDAPRLCNPDFSLKSDPRIRFAGQITGTEGYGEAIASGLYVALNTFESLQKGPSFVLPTTTVTGSLFAYATDPMTSPYRPMHVNFGIIDPLPQRIRSKRERYEAYATRSLRDLEDYVSQR